MKTNYKGIIMVGFLLVALVFFPVATSGSINTENVNVFDDATSIFAKVPLSNEDIAARWSNLPTAEELWKSKIKFWVELSSSESLEDYDIMNYTTTKPNFKTGELNEVTHIWLQYNDITWIQVPNNLLT